MTTMKTSILAGLMAVTIALTGCSGAAGGNAKVASVDGTAITKAEYDKVYKELEKNFGMENLAEEQRGMMAEMVKQMALNKLILQTMIQNEADKSGITVSDEDVKAYKQEKLLASDELKAQFQEFLKQSDMSEADFDAMLKDNLLLERFMDVKGGEQVKVSEAEVKAFYDQNPERFQLPKRVRASHILVKAIVPQMKKDLREQDPKISDEALEKKVHEQRDALKKKADDLLAQVKANPAKFEELAKSQSDDTVAAQNSGDLGFMAEDMIDATFWSAIAKVPANTLVPQVVSTPFGFHVIKVAEHSAPRKESFQNAKGMIQDFLAQQKKQAFLEQWAQEARSQVNIVIEPSYQPKEEAQSMLPGTPAPQGGAAAGH